MGLRQRIGRRLLGGEIDRLQESMELMAQAYRRGPYVLSPESLARQLSELDSQLVDLLMRQRGFDIISGRGFFGRLDFTESDRLSIVDQSRWAFHFDAQAARAVEAWTDFGFGRNIKIKPRDPRLAEIWSEFWTAKRNRSVLKQSKLDNLSDDLVTDGELFFAFYADVEGRTTIRRFDTEDIREVIYEQDAEGNADTDVPLFYVQSAGGKTIYWPDWAAISEQLDKVEIPQGATRAEQMEATTGVKMQRVAFSDINGRGWPMTYRAIPWYNEYKEALHDWSAVAAAVAMFPRKVKHKGGSRSTDALKSALESSLVQSGYGYERNPPPAAGATWLENEAVDLRYDNPMRTGATEWQSGTMLLAGQMTAGDGLPLVYRGRPDSMQNRSVAEVTTLPWDQQTGRYYGLWVDTFQEWVEIVATFARERGNGGEFETLAADVSSSRPATLSTTTEDLVRSAQAIDTATVNMTLPYSEGARALTALVKLIMERFGASLDESEEDAAAPTKMEPGAATPEAPAEMSEQDHVATPIMRTCPLCGWPEANLYEDHKGLMICARCGKTFNPKLE